MTFWDRTHALASWYARKPEGTEPTIKPLALPPIRNIADTVKSEPRPALDYRRRFELLKGA